MARKPKPQPETPDVQPGETENVQPAQTSDVQQERTTDVRTVRVTVACNSLGEGGTSYARGDTFETTPERAASLGDSVTIET